MPLKCLPHPGDFGTGESLINIRPTAFRLERTKNESSFRQCHCHTYLICGTVMGRLDVRGRDFNDAAEFTAKYRFPLATDALTYLAQSQVRRQWQRVPAGLSSFLCSKMQSRSFMYFRLFLPLFGRSVFRSFRRPRASGEELVVAMSLLCSQPRSWARR